MDRTLPRLGGSTYNKVGVGSMKTFSIVPKIHELETFREFYEYFRPGPGDLLFTHEFLYREFMESLNPDCHTLFCERYGEGEPNDSMVTAILSDLQGKSIKRVFGIGGGTVLDVAKLLCVKGAKSCEEIFEDKIPLVRDKGLILAPTTCGTGCEMTCVSVIDIPARDAKIGKRIEANFADHAALIPELLRTLPHAPFALSAIDALVHAMEIYVTPTVGDYSRLFCREAMLLVIRNFRYLAENGMERRGERMAQFLRGSNYAGIALANTVCGAVHACAMHFGGKHHVGHGEANYLFLSAVFQQYARMAPDGVIRELGTVINEALNIDAELPDSLRALDELLGQILPRKPLREFGMEKSELPAYVDKVFETQQRLLVCNYVPMTKKELLAVYENAY